MITSREKDDMLKVNFYDSVDDKLLKFAVIVFKKIFCKHKNRYVNVLESLGN